MAAQIPIKNGVVHTDHLVAVAPDGSRVTGILDGQWTKELYNPSGTEVSGTVTVTVTELGSSGIYRITFTPNALGHWHLSLSNAANDQDHGGDFDCMAGILDDVYADTAALDSRIPSDPADESLQQAAHAQTQADIAALNDIDGSDVQTALTAQGYTAARAPNLDNLDAAITTRAVAGDQMALTGAAEASLVDANWDEDIVAAHGTGDTAGLLLRALGALISQRSNTPTLAGLLGVADAAGVDLPEQIDTELSAAHGSGAWDGTDSDWTVAERNQIRYRLALDGTQADPTTNTGTIEEILADTAALDSRIPSDPADESLQQASHLATQAAIAALNDPTAAAIADQVWEEILADHSGTAGSTAEALAACSAGMTGAYQIDVTVEDGAAVPVQGALIDIYDATNTNFLAQFYTDINGQVSLALDSGTYNLRVWATGYSFTVPEVLVVSGDASETIVGTAGVVISPPSQPDLCVLYGYVYDAGGSPIGGACVSAVPTLPQAIDDKQEGDRAIHTVTREDGYFEIELIRTAEVRFQIEFTEYDEIKTVPDAASQSFTTWP